MKKYFFKYFTYIFLIAIMIIAIQSGSIFLQYKSGREAWKRSIFETCVDNLESNLGRSMFPQMKIDGLDLFGSIAHDNRISGYLVRNSEGVVALTVGHTPDGRVLASIIPTDEKLKEDKIVKSKHLVTTLNATMDENNGSFNIKRGKIYSAKQKTSVPHDIAANDILGSITVSYMNDVLLTFDILTYSPRTYIYSRQIINPIIKSLSVSLPICFIIAFLGAWIVSSRNAKYIDSVRVTLKDLADGKENVSLKENKNNELNEITVAIKDLGNTLSANKKSRIAWLNSISHDLNTPAMGMKMIIDGMIDGIFKPNKHNLKDLQNQNEILSQRINRVIEYSTLIADSKAEITEINAKSFVQNFKNIISDVNNDTIYCDKDLMIKAVNELIKNSNDYGTDTKLEIETIGDNYRITVSNTGKLPQNFDTNILFEPWSKGDSSRTSGGNGLGLPIVNAIASLHNGKAEIIQTEDQVKSSIIWPVKTI